jgi:UDP-glucose 4-epimerase
VTAPGVLVTGGAGFIGSHVAARFARDGWAVRVLDDFSTGLRANLDPAWRLVEADVCTPDAVFEAAAGCEAVVHLAAFTSVPESFERHRECYRVNALGTHRVLDASVRRGVRKVVFASSSAVYAELPDAPKREDDCPEPISPYAVSKLGGEHLLEGFAALHGLASVALRFFNVYGPRQPADSAYAAAVPIFIERGLRGEPLTVYGDGHQTRDFVYVEDVAEAVFRAACSPRTGVFNVGTARAEEILALANTIVKLTGGGPAHRFEPLRPGDVRSSTADVSRIAAALDWRSEWSLERGLQATLEWYRKQAVAAGRR